MNVAEEKVGRREMNAGRITIGFDVWPSMSANNGIPLNIIRELHTINRRLCELGFSGFSPLQVDLFVALRNTAVPSRFLCRRGWGLRSHRSFFKYPVISRPQESYTKMVSVGIKSALAITGLLSGGSVSAFMTPSSFLIGSRSLYR